MSKDYLIVRGNGLTLKVLYPSKHYTLGDAMLVAESEAKHVPGYEVMVVKLEATFLRTKNNGVTK
jgi:hypothetical protein